MHADSLRPARSFTLLGAPDLNGQGHVRPLHPIVGLIAITPDQPCYRTLGDVVTHGQAPLPSMPVERGKPGAGLLAQVLVSNYADHLPLYRR